MGSEGEGEGISQCRGTQGIAVIPGGVPNLDGTDLEKLEKVRKEAEWVRQRGQDAPRQDNLDLELRFFIDDICMNIVDREGNSNKTIVEANIKRIV